MGSLPTRATARSWPTRDMTDKTPVKTRRSTPYRAPTPPPNDDSDGARVSWAGPRLRPALREGGGHTPKRRRSPAAHTGAPCRTLWHGWEAPSTGAVGMRERQRPRLRRPRGGSTWLDLRERPGWQPIGVGGHEERDVPAAGGRLRGGKQGDFALRV